MDSVLRSLYGKARYSNVSESDFHNAILANKDNPLHALVYADWLDEQGHHHKASVIRFHANNPATLHPGARVFSDSEDRPGRWKAGYTYSARPTHGVHLMFTPPGSGKTFWWNRNDLSAGDAASLLDGLASEGVEVHPEEKETLAREERGPKRPSVFRRRPRRYARSPNGEMYLRLADQMHKEAGRPASAALVRMHYFQRDDDPHEREVKYTGPLYQGHAQAAEDGGRSPAPLVSVWAGNHGETIVSLHHFDGPMIRQVQAHMPTPQAVDLLGRLHAEGVANADRQRRMLFVNHQGDASELRHGRFVEPPELPQAEAPDWRPDSALPEDFYTMSRRGPVARYAAEDEIAALERRLSGVLGELHSVSSAEGGNWRRLRRINGLRRVAAGIQARIDNLKSSAKPSRSSLPIPGDLLTSSHALDLANSLGRPISVGGGTVGTVVRLNPPSGRWPEGSVVLDFGEHGSQTLDFRGLHGKLRDGSFRWADRQPPPAQQQKPADRLVFKNRGSRLKDISEQPGVFDHVLGAVRAVDPKAGVSNFSAKKYPDAEGGHHTVYFISDNQSFNGRGSSVEEATREAVGKMSSARQASAAFEAGRTDEDRKREAEEVAARNREMMGKLQERFPGMFGRPERQSRRGSPRRYAMDPQTAVAAVRANPTDPAARGAMADYLEENDLHARPEALGHLRSHPGPVWILQRPDGKVDAGPHLSIDEIRQRMQAAGSHWWDRASMRSFGTRVGNKTFSGPGGTWFVTSDHDFFRRRGFTLRHYDPDSGDINTVGRVAVHGVTRPTMEREAARLSRAPTALFAHNEMYHGDPDGQVVQHAYWLHSKGLISDEERHRLITTPHGQRPIIDETPDNLRPIIRWRDGQPEQMARLPRGLKVRLSRAAARRRAVRYAKCPRCGSPGKKSSSKFYKWKCPNCGLSHSRTQEGKDGKLPWVWGGKKGYSRPVRYARPSDYNALFAQAAQKFHDSLPPDRQAAHEVDLAKFQSLDHYGIIRQAVRGDDEAAHDIATRLLYGGVQGRSFFAGHDPDKGSLTNRFVTNVGWLARNVRREKTGVIRRGHNFTLAPVPLGSLGEKGEPYEPEGRKVSSELLMPAVDQQRIMEEALKEMKERGLTRAQIAEALGMTTRQVEKQTARLGIGRPKAKNMDEATRLKIVQMRASGVGATEIARQLGIARQRVHDALAKTAASKMSRPRVRSNVLTRPTRYAEPPRARRVSGDPLLGVGQPGGQRPIARRAPPPTLARPPAPRPITGTHTVLSIAPGGRAALHFVDARDPAHAMRVAANRLPGHRVVHAVPGGPGPQAVAIGGRPKQLPAPQGPTYEAHVITYRSRDGVTKRRLVYSPSGVRQSWAALRAAGHFPLSHRPATVKDLNSQPGSGPVEYEKWRAPVGGMSVRGIFYPGGKMIPDLGGRFVSPKR